MGIFVSQNIVLKEMFLTLTKHPTMVPFRKLFLFSFLLMFQIVLAHPRATIKEIDSINNLPFDYKIANTSKVIKLTFHNIEKAKEINYKKGIAQAYANLGTLYYYQGKYDKNTFYMLKAIRFFEQQNDMKALVWVYGDYGYQLKRRNMAQAAFYMNKAIKLGRLSYKDSELNAIYDNYGVLKEMQNDLDSAMYFYTKALKFKEVANDQLGIPYSLNKIAMVRIMQKKFSEAKIHLDKAYAIRLKRNDQIGIAENLNFYGHYFKESGNLQQAVVYFNKALTVSKKYDYKNLVQENYQQLSELYQKNNEFEKALECFKNHVQYKDSIQNLELRTRQAEFDIEYETERKEKEILVQKANVAQKNFWILTVGSLLVVSVLLGFLFYGRQRAKNRQLARENELKAALQRIENQNELQNQRLAISRDLHDNIGSQLTFIISSVDNLKYRFSIEDQQLKDKLQDISRFTRTTITELRDTIWAMNKEELSFYDLKNRITNFIESAKKASEYVEFTFEIDPEISDAVVFSSLKGINLYRIIQEGINNGLKHAEARQIEIAIRKKAEGFVIQVKDNGKGFDENSVVLNNGIANMKKRISEIGGQFSVQSKTGEGTIITVEWS
ncbi:sensor histidine kinase [Flavobacterium sp. SM15]|uniref:tetratricopeptide repeat-containing sensor histidine kinase n=1 Tax=Flavobacterium sp. SM15 TaxID=2908005 RepID=UPI001EDC81D6|nr:ATP-binding protein [Flavobacterium sp. SM15]MCG2610633.1 sensor histidine kinase [Flavobacterium sp. SM15]